MSSTKTLLPVLVAQAKKVNYGVTVMGTTDSEEVDVVPDFDPLVSDEIFYSQTSLLKFSFSNKTVFTE